MFPNTVEFLGRERDKERLAEAEHIRLGKIARGEQPNGGRALRMVTNLLGSQLVKWGVKWQSHGSAPLPKDSSIEMIS